MLWIHRFIIFFCSGRIHFQRTLIRKKRMKSDGIYDINKPDQTRRCNVLWTTPRPGVFQPLALIWSSLEAEHPQPAHCQDGNHRPLRRHYQHWCRDQFCCHRGRHKITKVAEAPNTSDHHLRHRPRNERLLPLHLQFADSAPLPIDRTMDIRAHDVSHRLFGFRTSNVCFCFDHSTHRHRQVPPYNLPPQESIISVSGLRSHRFQRCFLGLHVVSGRVLLRHRKGGFARHAHIQSFVRRKVDKCSRKAYLQRAHLLLSILPSAHLNNFPLLQNIFETQMQEQIAD